MNIADIKRRLSIDVLTVRYKNGLWTTTCKGKATARSSADTLLDSVKIAIGQYMIYANCKE